MKLYDSELKVMDLLWKEGDATAKQLAQRLRDTVGWNRNTTYTVIKKCVAKGAVARVEPHFLCHALVSRAEVQREETEALIGKLFDGSPDLLFASLLGGRNLTREQIADLRRMAAEMEERG